MEIRQILEQEIIGTEAAIKAAHTTITVHEIVLKAFKAELAKLPPKVEDKDAKDTKK